MTLIQFDDGSGRRIGNAVRFVEELAGKRKPVLFDSLTENAKRSLKLGTFTGNWDLGTYKTVTLHGSTQTVSVYNWCNSAVGAGQAESRYVIFGNVRGTNSAVEIQLQGTGATCHMTLGSIDLTTIEGYEAGQIQILGHNSTGPCLQWYSIATCSTSA